MFGAIKKAKNNSQTSQVNKDIGKSPPKLISKETSNRRNALITSVIFAVIGTILLISTHAATTPVSFEAEDGTVSSPASIVANSSASGGSVVKFGAGTTCTGVTVNSTDNLASMISTNPAGTTFCIVGNHHIENSAGYTPLNNDKFIGVGTTAAINGAKVITGWTPSGSDFVATGSLPSSGSTNGLCLSNYPLCGHAQDIFLDDTWLFPVSSQSALAPGKAYLDYANNKIYIRDNPSSKTVEQSWATRAFGGSGTVVLIKNLTVKNTASLFQAGAIDMGGTGWVIDHNNITHNHGYGIGAGSNTGLTATYNHIYSNGEIGTGGDGPNVDVEFNEVDHNNYAGYDYTNEGGNKFGHTVNMVVKGNYYHDDMGPGIWCDINCVSGDIEDNYVAHEADAGIFYEISCGTTAKPALIKNNIVVGSAQAQIKISGSNDVEVTGNKTFTDPSYIHPMTGTTLEDQRGIWGYDQGRTDHTGACPTVNGAHHVFNLNVHNNDEDLNGPGPSYAGKTGLWTDTGSGSFYTSGDNNRFVANTYHATSPGAWWDWNICGQYACTNSFSGFQSKGQDTTGSLTADNPTPPAPPALVTGPQP